MDDYIERGKAAELLCKMICGNDRAKRYAEKRFGDRKLALLVRMAVEEYLERCGEMK